MKWLSMFGLKLRLITRKTRASSITSSLLLCGKIGYLFRFPSCPRPRKTLLTWRLEGKAKLMKVRSALLTSDATRGLEILLRLLSSFLHHPARDSRIARG